MSELVILFYFHLTKCLFFSGRVRPDQTGLRQARRGLYVLLQLRGVLDRGVGGVDLRRLRGSHKLRDGAGAAGGATDGVQGQGWIGVMMMKCLVKI